MSLKGLGAFNKRKLDFEFTSGESPKSRNLTTPNNLQKIKIKRVDESIDESLVTALLNPSSVSEQKAANWVKKYIPGQSDPLLQWVNGTEKTVSFSVKVTKDLATNQTVETASPEAETLPGEVNNSIPVNFGAILYDLSAHGQANNDNRPPREVTKFLPVSIQPNLDYYRSLVIPRDSSRGDETKNPPLIELEMGQILGSETKSKQQRWILANYSFNVTKTTPRLQPIEANVSFTFIEYVPRNKTLNELDIEQILDEQRPNLENETFDTGSIDLGSTLNPTRLA